MMSPENMNGAYAEAPKSKLSAVDAKIINVIYTHCVKTANQVPYAWEEINKDLDFKTVDSARARYGELCEKYEWFPRGTDQDRRDTTSASPTPEPEEGFPGAPPVVMDGVEIAPIVETYGDESSGWEADVDNAKPICLGKRKHGRIGRTAKERAEQKAFKKGRAKKRCVRELSEASDIIEASPLSASYWIGAQGGLV